MKSEYREKLDKVIEAFLLSGIDYRGEGDFPLSEEEAKRRGDMFDELIMSGDAEVLRELMGLLAMRGGGDASLDEHFAQEIFLHYTDEQIAEAIFEKFDAIYDNDGGTDDEFGMAYILEGICSELWDYGRTEEGFQVFRQMFNKVRPRHAERFLNEMDKTTITEEKAMIQTLREDMAKW
jgi:hypothetical protein